MTNDTQHVHPFGLGRIHVPDERDAQYPMRGISPARSRIQQRIWTPGPVLDQGNTSECTAFGWKTWLGCAPLGEAGLLDPHTLYQAEQEIDGIAGPHDGSTVRAGAQRLRQWGYAANYLWAQSIDEIRAWVLQHGPVEVGTDWYESMFHPDASGAVRLDESVICPDTGTPSAGGHAWTVIGFANGSVPRYRAQNTWGANWGDHGRFWIAEADLAKLLANDGEACVAVKSPIKP